VTPPTPAGAPDTPTLNSATGSVGQVTLAWTQSASDHGATITGYKIYRGTTSGSEAFVNTAPAGTGYVDINITNGQTYSTR